MQLKFGDQLLKLDKILILQKRAIRFMTYNGVFPLNPGPLSPSDSIFIKLNFLKVDDIYKYQVSKFVFVCEWSKQYTVSQLVYIKL